MINEFRIGYNRLFGTVSTLSGGQNLSKQFAITGVPDDMQANGLAIANIAGFSSLGDNFDRRNGAIGNLQQWLLGTHHGVSRDQLQVYLDEFVFRHNRRKTPMAAFQTLLGLGVGHKPTKYKEIRGTSDLGEPPPEG
jgi:ISXO2-like transposase domain